MRNLNPEITRAITRNLDFGAMMHDITTLNRDNENIIKWAFGEGSAHTPKTLTADQTNLAVIAHELGGNKEVNNAVSLWRGSQQERNEIKIYFVWHIFNEIKRYKFERLTMLN